MIVALTDDLVGHVDLLATCEPLHRQLRPHVTDYVLTLTRMFAAGTEMAVLVDHGTPRALGVYGMQLTTSAGLRLYVYDLVADETVRSAGHGGTLLRWLEARARQRGADTFALDSGVTRQRAHRFYFREGLAIHAFHFTKTLN